jgi:hypothetical protein
MGLDWLAGNKPKPGYEQEFADLLAASARGDEITEALHEGDVPGAAEI